MRRLPFLLSVSVGALYTATYPLVPHGGVGYDIWWQPFSFSAITAIIYATKRHRPAGPGAWWWIVVGLVLFAAGDLTYVVYDGLHWSLPYPGLDDAFYLCGYPPIAVGLMLMLRRSTPGRNWSSLIDAGIVATGGSIVSWIFLVEPYSRDSSETLAQQAVSMAYPSMDILLLVLVTRMLMTNGRRSPAFWWLSAAVVLQLTGDASYGAGSLYGFYWNGSVLDLPLAGAYICFGCAALHPSMVRLTEPTYDPERRLSPARLALLCLSSMLAPAMLCVGTVRAHAGDWVVAVGGGFVLFALVIARLAGLVSRHERAIRRERALREAAAALVAATDRATIYRVAFKTAEELMTGSRAQVNVLVDHASDGDPQGLVGTTATFPLDVLGKTQGAIVVETEQPLGRSEREALEMLSTQVALALESDILAEDLRRAEERRGEERLSAFILHSTDAIFLLDEEHTIVFSSPAGADLLGTDVGDQLGLPLLDWVMPSLRAGLARTLHGLATLATGSSVPIETQISSSGGHDHIVEGTACNLLADENMRGVVVTLRDVTARAALEKQLTRRALHDDLTGLPNRALFADRVAHALSNARREPDAHVAVLFVDLDDFKAINDGMGHTAGDELLRGVAARIRAGLRPSDTVARLGGDEFAVLVEDVSSLEQAYDVARRVIELLALPIDVGAVSLAVPASVGLAVALEGSTVESLLRDADIAMYTAKSQGKGRIALFDETLRDVATRRLALKIDLPEALREGQFALDYQPIQSLDDRQIIGFEALIRWHHPTRGLLSPEAFIPAAEQSGLIVEIGRWVLEQACAQTVGWNRESGRPLSISINVSGVQMHHPGFTEQLRTVLRATGIDPGLVTLELTESVLVEHDRVMQILDGLREIGVKIAIDDFGTGYSSLSYLQRFPVTSVKIDRSFVADLTLGGDPGLVQGVLSLAEALNLTTVAEGVETSDQLEALSQLGCDLTQGYFVGRPCSAEEISALLAGRPS